MTRSSSPQKQFSCFRRNNQTKHELCSKLLILLVWKEKKETQQNTFKRSNYHFFSPKCSYNPDFISLSFLTAHVQTSQMKQAFITTVLTTCWAGAHFVFQKYLCFSFNKLHSANTATLTFYVLLNLTKSLN